MLLLIFAILLCLVTQARGERIWIEAEDATSHSFSGVFDFPGIVSGDKILRLWEEREPGADGYTASYEFAISSPGAFHVWVAASVQPSTSNFWWKLDGGEYQHITEDFDRLVWKLFGVSKAMCWMELAKADLQPGKHVLTIMVNERRPKSERAYLAYLDAILITSDDVVPGGLVTKADVPSLPSRKEVTIKPIQRAGKPGKRMMMGSSVMSLHNSRLLKHLGFTLLQTDSDHLTVNETSPGVWDWTHADSELETCKEIGVGWQYFPHFHWAPEWLKKMDKFVPAKCLGHGREIGCMSLWSPYLLDWIDHGYRALAEHYGNDGGNIEAIYLGIYGDFGEVHFPAGYHPDEVRRFGKEGAGHHDWWCGDGYARRDFADKMQRKYKTIAALNEAWDAKLSGFEKVEYPQLDAERETPGQRRQWLDFVGWYYDSMTEYAASIFRIARKYFPKAMLVVPLGCGDEAITHGQDNTALPKIARKYGVHIRSTHGGYLPVPQNYGSMLGRIASACKFYKAPFWTEPPGGISVEGEVGRFFEAISCGSFGYWDWGMNPTNAPHVFEKYGAFLTTEQPVVDIALFYPTTDRRLHPEFNYPPRFREGASAIRDVVDYDILDERMIEDGALKGYRVLVLFEGNFVESRTLRKIEAWVKSGGVVVSCNFGPIASVEGDESVWRRLFGIPESATEAPGGPLENGNEDFPRRARSLPDATIDKSMVGLLPNVKVLMRAAGKPVIWANRLGKGYAFYFAGSWESRRTYYELLCDIAYNISVFDPEMRNTVEVDAAWDGVYCTLLPSGEVIVHNFNDKPAAKEFAGKLVQLEPKSLASVMLEGHSAEAHPKNPDL